MRAPVREKDWQQTIVEAAQVLGWSCYHTFDSRHSAPGFPDLICVRERDDEGRMLAIEVKTERGKLSRYQVFWLDALDSVPGVRAMVARPSDWDAICEALA